MHTKKNNQISAEFYSIGRERDINMRMWILCMFSIQIRIQRHGNMRMIKVNIGIVFNVVLVAVRSRCDGNKTKKRETNENYIE